MTLPGRLFDSFRDREPSLEFLQFRVLPRTGTLIPQRIGSEQLPDRFDDLCRYIGLTANALGGGFYVFRYDSFEFIVGRRVVILHA